MVGVSVNIEKAKPNQTKTLIIIFFKTLNPFRQMGEGKGKVHIFSIALAM